MTTPNLMPLPKQQYLSILGTPLVGAKVYTYAAGTTTPKTTWTDAAGATPQPNPIPLNARGEPDSPIYWSGNYRVDVRDALGNLVYSVDNFNTDPAGLLTILTQLAASAGGALVGYIASGAGAVARTLLDRGRDTVSAFDFMTPTQIANVRAGVATDITTAVQAAMASFTTYAGTVDLPPGNFRISAPLVTTIKGLRLRGASKYGTYLTAADGSTFDMLRIAHQQCEVSGIIFRPASATQVPIRVYAGRTYIHDNYLLAAVNNSGIGIMLTDTTPDTSAFVPGAYTHVIENNIIGDSGFAFANGIYDNSAQGITSTKFLNNTFLSDRPIQMNKGGANTYSGNLFQSSTGTSGTKAGVGLTFGTAVVGEKVWGNYFELFLAMIETRTTDSTYQIFHAIANHNDNCNAAVADAGAKNYVIEDTVGKVENRNGWSTRYTTTWGVNANGGIPTFGADATGNCFIGASSGASHVINRPGSTEGTVILNLQGAGVSIGYLQDARGGTINGANTMLALNKNTTTSRSINAAGTVNASGADYAEYMCKAAGCGDIAKGQIVGINGRDEITDRWADAVAFAIKSTDPSYVGGDTWAAHLGTPPVMPSYVEPEYTGMVAGRAPLPQEPSGNKKWDKTTATLYAKRLAIWQANEEQEQHDRAAHADLVAQAKADHAAALAKWEADSAQYSADIEAARATVDRIAFCGRVPVNVLGAAPGQFIVPVQGGDGIKGIAVANPTFEQYTAAVGKVVSIDADGRARVIVKSA